jgi:chemotaxis signal transduction protein
MQHPEPDSDRSEFEGGSSMDRLPSGASSLVRADAMLARPLTRDDLEANTRMVARPAERAAATRGLLVFAVGAELLALDAVAMHRVVPATVIRRVPHRTGGSFLGIASVAGELAPVCDLGRALGIEGEGPRTHFVVIGAMGARWAFPVARVHGVHRIETAAIVEPPATVRHAMNGCTVALASFAHAGDATRFAAVLDAERLARLFARSLP